MIGQTISRYKILDKLGEGGMGVVYRAEDTKLDRPVALKFLPAHLLGNEEIRKRFEREAKAAAALDHPNVCHVHEIDEANGQKFISMSLIEGESLDKKIAHGPLKFDEALSIAQQVAKGLEAAHSRGIVHRDIKPENIMVGEDGHVTIMDFGLAQLTEASRLTKTGETVGTVAYMSPEQTEGSGTDHRTDIWSLGVVLYEMITGQQPFKGDYDKAVMYSILNEEPEPITALRTGVSMALEEYIAKALAKDPDNRYQQVGELAVDLRMQAEKLKSSRTAIGRNRPEVQSQDRTQDASLRQRNIGLAVGGVGMLVALFTALFPLFSPQTGAETRSVRRFVIPAEGEGRITSTRISPDGKYIVYGLVAGGESSLWLRPLESESPRMLAGTEGATDGFWSPDSQFIAFAAGGELKRISLEVGTVIKLCDLFRSGPYSFLGAAWDPAGDSIVFSSRRSLYTVPARGGEHELLLEREGDETLLAPLFLPGRAGSRAIVFRRDREGTIELLNLETGKRHRLTNGTPRDYSAMGLLLYEVDSGSEEREELWAVPLSLETLDVSGEPFPVAQNASGGSVAADGTLVYAGGGEAQQQLVWLSRSGERLGVGSRPYPEIGSFELSPDGQRALLETRGDIYVEDLERSVSTQLTFTEAEERYPTWAPWGAIFSTSDGKFLYRPVDRSQDVQVLRADVGTMPTVYDVDSEGRHILCGVMRPSESGVNFDIMRMERMPDGSFSEPSAFFEDPFSSVDARFSPDDNYVAYSTLVDERWDVYVQPFPAGGSQVQITPDGGSQVRWSQGGSELFFVSGDTVFSVPVTFDPEFRPGKPEKLFSLGTLRTTRARPLYEVDPKGERFLVLEDADGDQRRAMHVVQNWYEELRHRE